MHGGPGLQVPEGGPQAVQPHPVEGGLPSHLGSLVGSRVVREAIMARCQLPDNTAASKSATLSHRAVFGHQGGRVRHWDM